MLGPATRSGARVSAYVYVAHSLLSGNDS
jgi:hypothetical protein